MTLMFVMNLGYAWGTGDAAPAAASRVVQHPLAAFFQQATSIGRRS